MDIARFTSAFSDARYRQRTDPEFDLPAAQESLRRLLADEPDSTERQRALRMIDRMAEPQPEPRRRSALYAEAGAIHAAAWPVAGTVEEQIAALADARRRIWAIADRASVDEAADIRAMTRVLEHLEEELREPTWPLRTEPPAPA